MIVRMLSADAPITLVRETTGERIVRLRSSRDWTQEQLSEVAGLSIQTISRAENGCEIYASTLDALALALETTMDAIWRGTAS